MRKTYAVLGGGRLGSRIATELYESGADVILIDRNHEVVNKLSESVTSAICGDISNEDILRNAGVGEADAVIITLNALEPSILAVLAAKEMNIPLIITKAKDETMGDILKKVGADRVIYPEREAGYRLAHTLLSSNFLDFFEISNNVSIVEMFPKKEWIGKTLKQLDLRRTYRINVIAIMEKNDVKVVIDPDEPLKAESPLLVIVHKNDIKRIR